MITPLYTALLGLLFIVLSVRTITARRKAKLALGTGKSSIVLRATRVHANFSEYAPIALLLAYMMEQSGVEGLLVHLVCSCLLLGRSLHAYGVSQSDENFKFRVTGMSLTFASIFSSSLVLLYLLLF